MSTPEGHALSSQSGIISRLTFHPQDPDLLLSASWDNTLCLHSLSQDVPILRTKISIGCPALDCCWGRVEGDGERMAFVAGTRGVVHEIDLETQSQRVLAKHEAPVKCLAWDDALNGVVSASWDSTMALHDPRSPTPTAFSIALPAKAYSLDVVRDKVLVAMAERKIWVWDVRQLGSHWRGGPSDGQDGVWQKRESSLKFQTRCVKGMPSGEGFATSSTEGRVAVDFFDPTKESAKYAFKCHRKVINGVDTIYPVNALAFHPIHGTFATGGSDSMVSVWDAAAKKRLRQFPQYSGLEITSLAFNVDGTRLAIGTGTMFDEQGRIGLKTDGEGGKIWVRDVGMDCNPKK
ncbi:WD40 repeat-like protein [Atractiella rhizophila]|nr:WD40 repeat-like protein [Atractiella rhizophila]